MRGPIWSWFAGISPRGEGTGSRQLEATDGVAEHRSGLLSYALPLPARGAGVYSVN